MPLLIGVVTVGSRLQLGAPAPATEAKCFAALNGVSWHVSIDGAGCLWPGLQCDVEWGNRGCLGEQAAPLSSSRMLVGCTARSGPSICLPQHLDQGSCCGACEHPAHELFCCLRGCTSRAPPGITLLQTLPASLPPGRPDQDNCQQAKQQFCLCFWAAGEAECQRCSVTSELPASLLLALQSAFLSPQALCGPDNTSTKHTVHQDIAAAASAFCGLFRTPGQPDPGSALSLVTHQHLTSSHLLSCRSSSTPSSSAQTAPPLWEWRHQTSLPGTRARR